MPYPSRGAWRFRNVTDSFDFSPILESISIEELHPDGLSTLTCDVRDTGSIAFSNEDRVWVKFAGDKIWAGHIKVRTRTFLDEKGQNIKLWKLQGQDYTSKLEDSVITARGERARESADDRVAWILGALNFSITTTGVNLPAENVEPYDYENMTVREALQQVSDELILHFYIDFGPDDGGPPDLHMFRQEDIDPAFSFDVDAPNLTTRFPFSEFSFDDDSQDYKNAVRVRGDKIRQWITNPTQIALRGRQETPLTDSSLFTMAQVRAAGNRVLDQNDTPEVHGELLTHEPGVRAGMRIHIRLDAWSVDTNYYVTQVAVRAVDPHDSIGEAYLFSTLSFTDKRRVGRMPGGGRSKGGGSGGNGGGDRNAGDGRNEPARADDHACCGEPADMTNHFYESWLESIGATAANTVDLIETDTNLAGWWSSPHPWTTSGANGPNPTIAQDGTRLIANFTGGSAAVATFDVIDTDQLQPTEGFWQFDVETDALRAGSGVTLSLVDTVTEDIIYVALYLGSGAVEVFYEQQDPADTDSDTDGTPVILASTRYSVKWDLTIPGTFRARTWETGTPEPDTWNVTLSHDMDIPAGDVQLSVAGGSGGTQNIYIYPISISRAPESGESIKRLQFGTGDDSTVTFPLPYAPVRGSVVVWVSGIETEPESIDYDAPSVTFTSAPSTGARLVYSCTVA